MILRGICQSSIPRILVAFFISNTPWYLTHLSSAAKRKQIVPDIATVNGGGGTENRTENRELRQ